MNHRRSIWKLLLGVSGVALLVTNCTLKSATDDGCVTGKVSSCSCAGNKTGTQTCLADGTFGVCDCSAAAQAGANSGGGSNAGAANAGGGASSGGASASAGATSDGGATASAGEGGSAGSTPGDIGAAGAAGAGSAITDCYSCLVERCAPEWAACAANDENNKNPDTQQYCLSSGTNAAPGQIENIISCITEERSKGLVKRDVVRACGSSLGQSASTDFFVWAPLAMTPETEALMNCMADAPDEMVPGAWATDQTVNFPNNMPRAWDPMTCAKDFCTSSEAP